MNRRTFITTTGSIATITAIAGCAGLLGENEPEGPESVNDVESTRPELSEDAEEVVEAGGMTIGGGGEGSEELRGILELEIIGDECVELDFTFLAYDHEGEVIEEETDTVGPYEEGDTDEIEYTYETPLDEAFEIGVEIDIADDDASCD